MPQICGRIVLHEMQCDPLLLAAALRQTVPPLAKIPLHTRYYCYWRSNQASEIEVLEVDEFGYYRAVPCGWKPIRRRHLPSGWAAAAVPRVDSHGRWGNCRRTVILAFGRGRTADAA